MNPVERDVIRRKLDRIIKCLHRIREAQDKSLDEYLSAPDLQAILERQLELAIGAAIDLNVHLLVHSGLGTPADSYTSFWEIAQHLRAISPELSRQLAPLTGLRNHLLLVYDEIDPRQVYAGFHQALELLPKYIEAIEAHLTKLPIDDQQVPSVPPVP
jgi:uncharacterized protein YutE (UPF0331/DUF86 family)